MTGMTRFFIVVGLLLLVCAVVSKFVFALELASMSIKSSSYLIAANICFTLGLLYKK